MELKQLPRSSNKKPRFLSYVAYSKPYTLDYSRAGLLPTASLWDMLPSDPPKTLTQWDPQFEN